MIWFYNIWYFWCCTFFVLWLHANQISHGNLRQMSEMCTLPQAAGMQLKETSFTLLTWGKDRLEKWDSSFLFCLADEHETKTNSADAMKLSLQNNQHKQPGEKSGRHRNHDFHKPWNARWDSLMCYWVFHIGILLTRWITANLSTL